MDITLKELNYTNIVLRMIDTSIGLDTLNSYIDEVSTRNYVEMKSMEHVKVLFGDSIDNFLDSLSYEELMDLRSYTGYNYKFINAILRDRWSYDEHGQLTDDKKREYGNISRKISDIVDKFNVPNIDFMCFRGTKIDAFKGYGIRELSQLKNLVGKYLYERAFTSTSILCETSYFKNKNLEDQYKCNIEVRYLIPSESNDGALLTSSDTSYSISQNEFLLNIGSLAKVIDVEVDEVNNKAILTAVLIPKRIYELTYGNDKNVKR